MLPSALVLAAGLSLRMGTSKLLLPWGGQTVIREVVSTLITAGVDAGRIWVVTGHEAGRVTAALDGLSVRTVFNPDYASGEMIGSVQTGLATILAQTPSGGGPALICLGDQPQMQAATVRAVLAAGQHDGWGSIVIPSYQMRRGHPVLLPRTVWPDVMATGATLRDVFAQHSALIRYVTVDTASILADLDTPEDYRRVGPAGDDARGG